MLLAALLFVFLWSSIALAEKRVALVIGNSAYLNVPKLPNPRKDAEVIAKFFRGAGFDIVDGKVPMPCAALCATSPSRRGTPISLLCSMPATVWR
jgi:hypothetical protein